MKPLLFFDIETTGLDPVKDRIISLAIKDSEDGARDTWLFNPNIPIPPEATKVHGITDEMARKFPIFHHAASAIHRILSGCDLAGFNLIHFDIPFLWEEFYRAGIEWDLTGVQVIDAGNIFKRFEERTLSAAIKFYCGRVHEKAHDALGDVMATEAVLNAQIDRYDLQFKSREELAALSRFDNRFDLAGLLVKEHDGTVCFNFGKHKGKPVLHEKPYVQWMLSQDFPTQTKKMLRELGGIA
jgi:DNA polymerase-3 subunit epsilon